MIISKIHIVSSSKEIFCVNLYPLVFSIQKTIYWGQETFFSLSCLHTNLQSVSNLMAPEIIFIQYFLCNTIIVN